MNKVKKVSIRVTKKWVEPEKYSVIINLLASGKEIVKSIKLNKENGC